MSEENKENVVEAEVVEQVKEEVKEEPVSTQPNVEQTQNTNGYNPTFQPKPNLNNINTNNNGTVPPTNNNGPQVIYVEKPRKPFPWKTVLKYVCVFLVAGLCGFGGGLLANQMDHSSSRSNDMEFDEDNMPSMPDFSDGNNAFGGFSNGNNDSSSNGSSSSKTNTNSAGIGIQITESDDGVYIKGFSNGSNAEDAGLKIGDKIVALDGKEYDTYDDIVSYLSDKEVGDTVDVTVERDDEEKTFTVELSAMSSSNTSLPSSSESEVQ